MTIRKTQLTTFLIMAALGSSCGSDNGGTEKSVRGALTEVVSDREWLLTPSDCPEKGAAVASFGVSFKAIGGAESQAPAGQFGDMKAYASTPATIILERSGSVLTQQDVLPGALVRLPRETEPRADVTFHWSTDDASSFVDHVRVQVPEGFRIEAIHGKIGEDVAPANVAEKDGLEALACMAESTRVP